MVACSGTPNTFPNLTTLFHPMPSSERLSYLMFFEFPFIKNMSFYNKIRDKGKIVSAG
jgi:hypothetical protein